MKRLFVFAAAAASLTAVSCQKTYVVDEVNTPIGFSTKIGKQTKAIMDDGTYKTNHTFGVFAYALTGGKSWEGNAVLTNQVMDNVEISYQVDKWKAVGDRVYYWPNATDTKLNFFMYSPYKSSLGDASVTVDVPKGITLSNYVHVNHNGSNAVDFMVADATDQTYANTSGTVSFSFAHKMTQVEFKVVKDASLKGENGASITLNNLTLRNINNTASYESDNWTLNDEKTKADFAITSTGGSVTDNDGITLAGATMIPQTLNVGQQKISIEYSISGPGFADETVTREFDIRTDNMTTWGVNKKITYTLTIKMNEIFFQPSVTNWDTETEPIDVPNTNN